MNDKNNVEIGMGDEVMVPEPNTTDIHNSEFVGTVREIIENENLIVIEDQDSDFFEIEPDRLEVLILS